MRSTDFMHTAPGTIRKLFGTNIGSNVVHGSDASEAAALELSLFFGPPSPEYEEKRDNEQ